jgi:photosystem II stability/assembly factor-like uncharacterized protein
MRSLLLLILLILAPIFGTTVHAQERWIRLDSVTEQQLMSVQFFDASRGYVAGRQGLFMRTFDGGRNWEQSFITYPHEFARIDVIDMFFHDSLIGVVAGSVDTSNGLVADPKVTLFWTYDGGKTWDPQMFNEDGAVQKIQFLDRKFGFFAASKNDGTGKASVYYTNGGGFSTDLWTKRTNFPAPQIVQGMAFKDNATGIISAGDELVIPSNLYLTHEAGDTWETFVGSNNGSSASFDGFHWNDDGLLATSGSRVMFSLDEGHTWGVVASTAGSAFYRGFTFADNKVGFAIPMFSGQVLKTTNGGYAWEVQQLPEFAFLMDMWAVTEQVAYAVGAGGKIFKLTAKSSVKPIERASTLSLYPNPAKQFAIINCAASAGQRGAIFDALGRRVMSVELGADGSAKFDLRWLTPGLYSVVVDGHGTKLVIE